MSERKTGSAPAAQELTLQPFREASDPSPPPHLPGTAGFEPGLSTHLDQRGRTKGLGERGMSPL